MRHVSQAACKGALCAQRTHATLAHSSIDGLKVLLHVSCLQHGSLLAREGHVFDLQAPAHYKHKFPRARPDTFNVIKPGMFVKFVRLWGLRQTGHGLVGIALHTLNTGDYANRTTSSMVQLIHNITIELMRVQRHQDWVRGLCRWGFGHSNTAVAPESCTFKISRAGP